MLQLETVLRSLYIWDTFGMCMRAQGSLIVEVKPGSVIWSVDGISCYFSEAVASQCGWENSTAAGGLPWLSAMGAMAVKFSFRFCFILLLLSFLDVLAIGPVALCMLGKNSTSSPIFWFLKHLREPLPSAGQTDTLGTVENAFKTFPQLSEEYLWWLFLVMSTFQTTEESNS